MDSIHTFCVVKDAVFGTRSHVITAIASLPLMVQIGVGGGVRLTGSGAGSFGGEGGGST